MAEDARPDPLVPPEVDLRDYDYLPLYGDRLFDSDTWALCDADEKVAALRLWWKAWHEEPAGSLPDNNRLLAERAGYGVAVKAFLAIKDNAMRGWILCSDGRLYHPVVASIAIEVWGKKARKRAENAADRERKKRKRGWTSAGQQASVRRTNGAVPPDNKEIPPDSPPDNAAFPPDVQSENALKGSEASKRIEPFEEPSESEAAREKSLNGRDNPQERRSAPPLKTPALRENIKDKLRQKLMRYCNARLRGPEKPAALLGLMGEDPDHDAQWWLDALDKQRKREGWDDTREWKRQHVEAAQ